MNNISLSNISKPIKNQLSEFSDVFSASMKSKVGLVDLVTKYILKQKGKKIRPLLVLLSSKISGEINERTYRGAVLVELLHTATLVHDDVVDNADKRRGFPSINAIWKNKIAVLMGDYLLSRGLMIAVEGNDFDFLKIMTGTVKRMSEGELLQIQKTRKLDINEETYFKIIADKTASLFETCCEIGARSSSENPGFHIAMRKYGENLGIAFQIKDDILDYEGSAKLFGKPIGGDIKEKKITLPLIHSLAQASKDEAANIKNLIKGGGKKDSVNKVINFVHEKNGIAYAEKIAKDYAGRAKKCLETFPENASKASLSALIDFVIERKQ
ncbi:MAG: polyprenyl synthetase [Ignavibacteria bacterium CG22_combo_CG10-13_8_21_14_all_37_15]|nr:MAG: polyprenyl synthetase [Ignavibacteria bacterium CG22_combo_CG10-13_8_21_14_all_37_15]